MVADALLLLVVGISSQAQGPVVDETSTAKRPRKNVLLLISWIDSILVGSFLFHISHGSTYRVNYQESVSPTGDLSSLPWPEGAGVSRKDLR